MVHCLVFCTVVSGFQYTPLCCRGVWSFSRSVQWGPSLAERTVLSADCVANLLRFCLDAMFLAYRREYYQRCVLEAWHIRTEHQTMNRNEGRVTLPFLTDSHAETSQILVVVC